MPTAANSYIRRTFPASMCSQQAARAARSSSHQLPPSPAAAAFGHSAQAADCAAANTAQLPTIRQAVWDAVRRPLQQITACGSQPAAPACKGKCRRLLLLLPLPCRLLAWQRRRHAAAADRHASGAKHHSCHTLLPRTSVLHQAHKKVQHAPNAASGCGCCCRCCAAACRRTVCRHVLRWCRGQTRLDQAHGLQGAQAVRCMRPRRQQLRPAKQYTGHMAW